MRTYTITVSNDQSKDIDKAVSEMRDPLTDEPISLQSLIETLLDDVSLAYSRRGSWEGSNMLKVLQSHGYFSHLW